MRRMSAFDRGLGAYLKSGRKAFQTLWCKDEVGRRGKHNMASFASKPVFFFYSHVYIQLKGFLTGFKELFVCIKLKFYEFSNIYLQK